MNDQNNPLQTSKWKETFARHTAIAQQLELFLTLPPALSLSRAFSRALAAPSPEQVQDLQRTASLTQRRHVQNNSRNLADYVGHSLTDPLLKARMIVDMAITFNTHKNATPNQKQQDAVIHHIAEYVAHTDNSLGNLTTILGATANEQEISALHIQRAKLPELAETGHQLASILGSDFEHAVNASKDDIANLRLTGVEYHAPLNPSVWIR